jgi:AcrR family transcriptional regulator
MSQPTRTDHPSSESIDGDGARRRNQRAQQKAETRRRLLEAATEVFIEDGPTTASLDKIAALANVSRSTLVFHFGSRTELMDAVCTYQLERYQSAGHEYLPGEFRPFVEVFLRVQSDPVFRLIWLLDDLLHPGGSTHLHPENPNSGYWYVVRELEQRLVTAGLDPGAAHERAVVLTPGLMMVGRRAAQDLAGPEEIQEFVDAACKLVLGEHVGSGGGG